MGRRKRVDGGIGVDHVVDWIFDLDNTLYPASCNLFAQIDRRMAAFIGRRLGLGEAEARQLHKSYFRRYGTTLRGLMVEHGIDPVDYLDYTHDIDLDPVPPSPALDAALTGLEGRKFIFTNATIRHVEGVVARLGVGHHFERVFDIVAADFLPKPDPATYRAMLDHCGVAPERAALFEDIARNLEPAAALGMTTVWIKNDGHWGAPEPGDDHIHHVADDLVTWLEQAAGTRRPPPDPG